MVGSASAPLGKFQKHFREGLIQGTLEKFIPLHDITQAEKLIGVKGSNEPYNRTYKFLEGTLTLLY